MFRGPLFSLIAAGSLLLAVMNCSLQDSGANNVANSNSNENLNVEITESTPEGGSAESRSVEAEKLVSELYKDHDAKKSPFFQTADRGRVDKYFTKTTADLIWKDATTTGGDIGALDFDPLYDAQDVGLKNFKVNAATVNGDSAAVPVTFTNFGEKKRISFVLKASGGKWKIDDIKYDAGHTLLAILKDTYGSTATNAPPVKNVAGEFEGTYRVGETTCTVRPVRQAFEIRWAKGSGSEYYFFKEATIFESEPTKSGGRNEFRFTDENYNSGTFHRADGKTLPVSRAK